MGGDFHAVAGRAIVAAVFLVLPVTALIAIVIGTAPPWVLVAAVIISISGWLWQV